MKIIKIAPISIAFLTLLTSISIFGASITTPGQPDPDTGLADQVFNYANNYLQLGMQYSNVFGTIVNSKVTKKLGHANAVALEFDYGNDENRFGVTWGVALRPNQLFKFTAERLEQKLPFDFVTGTVYKRIPQYAYGAGYEYILPHSRINDINAGVYYANARSEALAPIEFYSDGNQYIDYRHIAGATSQGASVGFDITPWNTDAVGLKLDYDEVRYNAAYTLQNTRQHSAGFGYTVDVQQLITRSLKFNAAASQRTPYDDYSAGFSWLVPITANRLELGFNTDYVVPHNSTPNDINYLLSMNFSFGGNSDNGLPHYYAPSFARSADLTAWTDAPAVHMERVLATADELIKKVALAINSALPGAGPTAGGTTVTIVGEGFSPSTTVSFGGVTAASVIFINSTMLHVVTPPHAAGIVDIAITNPEGNAIVLPNSFTYGSPAPAPSPSPTRITPAKSNVKGGGTVTITGSHLTGVTAVSFGGVPATQVKVANDKKLTCVDPAHAAGTIDVTVTGKNGEGHLSHAFTYYTVPSPSALEPTVGPSAGHTFVTIKGTGLTGVTQVTFAGIPARDVKVVNDKEVTCLTPVYSGPSGPVDVRVTNPSGSVTLSQRFTYLSIPKR